MSNRRGQSSLEYVLLLSALLLILLSVYMLSNTMDQRRALISSQLEGERVASRMARAMDAVALAGPGDSYNFSLFSSPNQTLIISGAEVLSFGPSNQTLAIARTLGNLTSGQTVLAANQNVGLFYNGTTITVTALG